MKKENSCFLKNSECSCSHYNFFGAKGHRFCKEDTKFNEKVTLDKKEVALDNIQKLDV